MCEALAQSMRGTTLTVLQALGYHFLGLVFNSGLYLAWAAVGKALTGTSPFFWLDEAEVGSKEAVTAYCIGFVCLAPTSESQSASALTHDCLTDSSLTSVHDDGRMLGHPSGPHRGS